MSSTEATRKGAALRLVPKRAPASKAEAAIVSAAVRAALDTFRAELERTMPAAYRLLDEIDAWASSDREAVPEVCEEICRVVNAGGKQRMQFTTPVDDLAEVAACWTADTTGWTAQELVESWASNISDVTYAGAADRIWEAMDRAVAHAQRARRTLGSRG